MSKPRKSSAKRATKKAAARSSVDRGSGPTTGSNDGPSEHERGMALNDRGASSETERGASLEREPDAGDRNVSVERPRDGRDGDADRNG